jgi:hypothetical protein
MHLDQPGTNLNSKYGQMLEMQDKKKASVTPTKKYAKGISSAPGGAAIVGENGPEVMIHKDKASVIGPDGPTLMHVPKGAEVVPNNKLSSFAKGTTTAVSTASNLINAGNGTIEKMVNMLVKAINDTANNTGQNINLIVDGRQLANVTHKRTLNRVGMRPNDIS